MGEQGLTDSLQVLHRWVHHGPCAKPVALGAQGLLESEGGLVETALAQPSPLARWDPQDSGLRLFLPLSPCPGVLCCKVVGPDPGRERLAWWAGQTGTRGV